MDKGSVTTQKKGGIGGGPFEWEDLKALVGPSHHDLSFCVFSNATYIKINK